MENSQTPAATLVSSSLVEIWFQIDKDKDGYPKSKSWEGMLAEPKEEGFELVSIPFYLKHVSRGDIVAADQAEFLKFRNVIAHSGHNTYRLLLTPPIDPNGVLKELLGLGVGVESTNDGMLLAVDVPPTIDQSYIDSFLAAHANAGRWEMQDGFLSSITTTND